MKNSSYLNLFFALAFLFSGQKDYSLKLAIGENKLPEKLSVVFTVISNAKQNIKIPNKESLVIGYKDDINSDCYFEVVEVTNSAETDVIPTGDYQYYNVNNKDKLNVLKPKQSQSYKFDVSDFYTLKMGKKYKLRLTFRLSKYNSVPDIVSDWLIVN
jgi:hypothetical protein